MLLFKILTLVNPGRTNQVHGQSLKPGQVLAGTRCLEGLLGIPRTTIHRHLKRFEKEGKIQLRVVPNRGGTVITIPALLNEGGGTPLGTQLGTENGTIPSPVGKSLSERYDASNGTKTGTQPGTPLGTKQERKKESSSLGKHGSDAQPPNPATKSPWGQGIPQPLIWGKPEF